MIATAPGKLIVTGEYAVLDGAPAIVLAIDRRAIAQRNATPRGSSPFLLAVADEIAARRGPRDDATRAALEISVDSTAFYYRITKLGLGSSAAVTVAATALALGTTDPKLVLEVALAAHARAQGPRGARGSGADIAAAVYGGTIVFSLAAQAIATRGIAPLSGHGAEGTSAPYRARAPSHGGSSTTESPEGSASSGGPSPGPPEGSASSGGSSPGSPEGSGRPGGSSSGSPEGSPASGASSSGSSEGSASSGISSSGSPEGSAGSLGGSQGAAEGASGSSGGTRGPEGGEGRGRSAGGTQPPQESSSGLLGPRARTISLTGLRGVPAELPEGLSFAPRARTTTQGGVRAAAGAPGDVLAQPSNEAPCRIERRRWPSSVAIAPFFTGVAADTAQLVAQVEAARETQRAAVDAALAAIADASRAACAALAAPPEIATLALIGAIALAGNAMDRLAMATGLDLVPACVRSARSALAKLGGTAKTTGAGGGDVGIAVFPATVDATVVTRVLIEAGCQPLRIAVDDAGVDLRPDAS